MSEKQPVYNTAIKSGEYLPVTPPRNPEFYIVTEKQAENAFRKWRDITKTTNAEMFEAKREWNQLILKAVYGGSGDSAELVSTGYTSKYGPVTIGGVQVKDKDVAITPGTKEYFEFTHYNGQPKKRREEMLLKQKKKEEKQDIGEEVTEEENIKPQISKVVKEKIIDDDGTDLSEDVLGESLNEKDLENTEGGDQTNTENFVPPIETDKPDPKTKVPPIIINHAECGHLTFGEEKDGETERPRDVGLYAGDSNALRLFRDGGFELRSSESAGENKIKGSSIMQVCNNATLLVNSEGDVTIRARNKLRLVADLVEIEAKNASTDGVTIIAEHDIKLRANNNTIITSDNITIDAKERILSHSQGWQILIGQYIRLHEPQTKICPAFLKEYIEGQIKTLRN